MKTTVFNCDKCGQPFEAAGDRPKPFITEGKTNILLDVQVNISKNLAWKSTDEVTITKQICQDCLKKVGLTFTDLPVKQQHTPNRESLEDKFIDILSELGVKFEE